MRRPFRIAALGMTWLWPLAAQNVAEHNPHTSAADVETGRQYFMGSCAYCHGPGGEGGRGPTLTTGRYRHGESDRELWRTVRFGVSGSEMGGTGLIESDIWRVVAYVRRLATAGAGEKALGDPAAGRLVYKSKGACAACHAIKGKGGSLGPDLSEIGLRRTVRFLRESLTDPAAFVADNFRSVTVVPSAGGVVRGIRLNEDDYSVQLRDAGESPRSFLKRNLKELRADRESLMPSYGSTLSQREIDDLVAYMNSLRTNP